MSIKSKLIFAWFLCLVPIFAAFAESGLVDELKIESPDELINHFKNESKILSDIEAENRSGGDEFYKEKDLKRVEILLTAYISALNSGGFPEDPVRQFEIHSLIFPILNQFGEALRNAHNKSTLLEHKEALKLVKPDLLNCKASLLMSRIWLDFHRKGEVDRLPVVPYEVYCGYYNPYGLGEKAKPPEYLVSIVSELAENSDRKSEILRNEAHSNCEQAKKSGRKIWTHCRQFYDKAMRKQLLSDPAVAAEISKFPTEARAKAVRAFLYDSGFAFGTGKNFDADIDFDHLAFAIDLYHTLPPGNDPPPSDITPNYYDKGMLWRFDEILGALSVSCREGYANRRPEWKKLNTVCDYYFAANNLDDYKKPARLNNAKYPSDTAKLLHEKLYQEKAHNE